jgi:hypothetical protein
MSQAPATSDCLVRYGAVVAVTFGVKLWDRERLFPRERGKVGMRLELIAAHYLGRDVADPRTVSIGVMPIEPVAI